MKRRRLIGILKKVAGFLTFVGVLLFAAYMLIPDETSALLNGNTEPAERKLIETAANLTDTVTDWLEENESSAASDVVTDELAAILPDAQSQNRDSYEKEKINRNNAGPESTEYSSDSYAYSFLSPEGQKVYLEVLDTLSKEESDIVVSTKNPEVLDKAFNCVMLDHPELFYVTGYSLTRFTRGKKIEKIKFSGTYTVDFDTAVKRQLLIDAAVKKCLMGIPQNASEYDKVKYVYEYIIYNTEYDVNSVENQNILSVLLNGRSVCQGYAKTTQYLLNKLGVFCILVEGNVKDNESHVLNIVRIDGNYYYLDTTWGDASYNLVSADGDSNISIPEISYDYMCVTDEMIRKTHVIKETVPLPVCDVMFDNYFVREGLYFTCVDQDALADAFSRAYESDSGYITLKCSDETVYAALLDFLISREHIFDYIHSSSSVNYVEMKEELGVLIYL